MALTGTQAAPPRRRILPTDWAVAAMFALYPLWWALGIGAFTWSLLAVPMAIHLILNRPIRIPGGFGVWALFLLCVAASVLQIDNADRLAGYVLRTSYYLAAAVIWLYVVNTTSTVTTRRLLGLLLALWMVSVAGGWLGLVQPDIAYRSPAAMALPDSLTENELIHDLVHPGFAEVQDVVGVRVPRPKAPYTYTNGWGSALSLLTPVAVGALASGLLSRRRARLVRVFLALSVVPIVASLNRGLWVLLVIAALYAVLRRRRSDRARTAVIAVLGIFLTAVLVMATPIGAPIRSALDTRSEDSNATRTALYEEAIDRTRESPILGFGGPRPSELTGKSVGTHGQIWTVLFSHGFPAAALYFSLFALLAWRTRNPPSTLGLWLHVTLVVGLIQMFFYGQLPHQLFILMVVAGLAERERATHEAPPVGAPVPSLQ